MKVTGKYSRKPYRCTRCGNEREIGTNHWGVCYPECPVCSWKNPLQRMVAHECLEDPPEGYGKPEPWQSVKLGDICEIK